MSYIVRHSPRNLLSRYRSLRMSSTAPRYSTEHSSAQAKVAKRPRLPVPDLHKTLQKYVQSLVPFLREREAHEGVPFDEAMDSLLRSAAVFEEGLGKLCQERLLGTNLLQLSIPVGLH